MRGAFGLPSFKSLERSHAPMKIATIDGRKVWVNDDYVAPKTEQVVEKVEPVKAEEPEKVEEPETKAKPKPANKAKKAPANKSRKAGSTK
jgi:hypothetical protein